MFDSQNSSVAVSTGKVPSRPAIGPMHTPSDIDGSRLSFVLELWFDFSCPYAYLASRQASRFGVEIDWRPMLLGGVFRGIGAGDGPMATLSPAKAAHNLRDMHRWAARFGVPFQMPAAHPMRTVRALRTLLALPHSRWPQAIEAI